MARRRAGVEDLCGPRFLNDPGELKSALSRQARALGFDCFGIAAPDSIGEAGRHFREFLAAGAHGEMDWLAAKADRRAEPRVLWPAVRSVILLGVNYGPDRDPLAILQQPTRAAISVYAQGDDYHDVIKQRLKALGRWLAAAAACEIKVFVDTAPVMEKPLAQAAGLGWQGKHTNLVSREFGSWLFLGAIFTTLELPSDQAATDHCGSCRACLDICPTAAFPAPYRLDARRCISYLTIELKGSIPPELRPALGNRIFGCDDCLAVCPWNRFAREGRLMRAHARAELAQPDLLELLVLDEAGFKRRFAGTPILRAKRRGLLRDVCVALGNVGDERALPALQQAAQDPEPLVAEHARWAMEQIRTTSGM
jgi:epoxyqueuosine reductase